MRRVGVVGAGRAGTAFATALAAAGWQVEGPFGRDDELADVAEGLDLIILATPDAAVSGVAAAIAPAESVVVAHVAGSLGLDVLAPHERRAALHPLMTLPAGRRGAENLAGGGWFAVAGDPVVERVVGDLGGRSFRVADSDRALYHAAACVAANHLVALMGQVQRLAESAQVPFEAYMPLAESALADVISLGPAAALTGPAARGDDATIRAHLEALPESERSSYRAMSELAKTLVERR